MSGKRRARRPARGRLKGGASDVNLTLLLTIEGLRGFSWGRSKVRHCSIGEKGQRSKVMEFR